MQHSSVYTPSNLQSCVPHVKTSQSGDSSKYKSQCMMMQEEVEKENNTESFKLQQLVTATSPLQILSVLKLALDEICAVNVLATDSTKGPLATDDLIPLLIGVLISHGNVDLPSLLQYTQIFGNTFLDFHDAFE
ncbi:hypothetical protein EB796_007191 [Bugula neritina]|uniref:VPS9 domain-containing protein n=1 Tax=Bugula neritina TaxID=10212 RepID=A0A7J7K795_BUGNE|nr:hypothetical protein EB796_007191 [Bugula neritina]